ncbi:MAG: hypothetical protein IH905_04040 [Proteobacteria bacterium]|nr:hypothetical protein [Pseudomonadota bacterium]
MLSTAPLPGPFGADISGLDRRRPLADETMREVLAATGPDDSRLLYRVSVKGRPPLA